MREAIAHHPQVSHVMLILALGTSLTATCKIGSLRSYWLALIFALDFIEAYLVSHLAEYLYLNWPQMAEIPYPSSIRCQLISHLAQTGRHAHHSAGAGAGPHHCHLPGTVHQEGRTLGVVDDEIEFFSSHSDR